ncbi:MAG: hypothetical protein ABSE64_15965 [Vulcanimicrobiaceae bacterium]|jgi:hypothetical protein
MPTEYDIYGPMDVPYESNVKGARLIHKAAALVTLDNYNASPERGCYVFGIRSHGKIRPYYVGKSANSFAAECFTPDKLVKYNHVLHRVNHGRPVMLFVVPSNTKGKFNSTALAALEQYLIGLAFQVNEDIQNVQGIPKPLFEIVGVHIPKKGPKGESLEAFCNAFEL